MPKRRALVRNADFAAGQIPLKLLREATTWIDELFADEPFTFRATRCLAREISRRGDCGEAYREVAAETHRPSCTVNHRGWSGVKIFSVHASETTRKPEKTERLSGAIMPDSNGVLSAFTVYNAYFAALGKRERGLMGDMELSWSQTFADPSELGAYMDTLRDMAVGAISIKDTFQQLIVDPAIGSGMAFPAISR